MSNDKKNKINNKIYVCERLDKMCYATDNVVRIFVALLLIVNVLHVENFEQYTKMVKSSRNDNGGKSDGPQVHQALSSDLWFPEMFRHKTQTNAKVETRSGRSASERIYPAYSPSSSSTTLTGISTKIVDLNNCSTELLNILF